MTDDVATVPPRTLEEALGYAFNDPDLLRTALTHRSYANENGLPGNYERLEFLGDAVLGLVTAHWLYRRFPERREGDLAKLKSFLVSAPVLSRQAESLGVGDGLRLGVGELRSGGRSKSSILADAMESVFGAVYLDGGMEEARRVVERILEAALAERPHVLPSDAKTALQESVQARGWSLPDYRLVLESGPDHRKTFRVECWVEEHVAGLGEGRSKKMAEQRAAADALEKLDLAGTGP